MSYPFVESKGYISNLSQRSEISVKSRERVLKSDREEETFDIWYEPLDPYVSDRIFQAVVRWFRDSYEISWNTFERNERSAIKKLCLALEAYRIETNMKYISVEDLVKTTTLPEFINVSKDYRKVALIRLFSLETIDDSLETLFFPYKNYTCIGDIFNYRFSIFYKEEIDDYKFGLIPVVEPSEDQKIQFVEEVEDMLPDDFIILDPLWPYQACNGSRGIDEEGNKVNCSDNSFKVNFDVRYEIVGRRVVIPISACNTRDAIMLDNDSATILRWCDAMIKKLFISTPGWMMLDDPYKFKRKFEKFRKKYNYFLSLDFEKEGITKPRYLISLVRKAIINKFGESPLTDFLQIYNDYSVMINDEVIHMERGHGLGFANSLTSVVLLALFRLTVREIEKEEYFSSDVGFLSFNDDSVIGFLESLDYDLFCEYIDLITDRYGHRLKLKKTFFGKAFVFCEEYSNEGFNNKDTYYRCSINCAKMCVNICHAKQYIAAISIPETLEYYLEDIISYWGYEFVDFEINQPIAFGGWVGRKLFNVDLTFWQGLPFNGINLYMATRQRVKLKTANSHPFLLFIDENEYFQLPIVERLNGIKLVRYFDKLLKKRQNAFNKQYDENLIDIYRDYCKRERCDVLPPKELIKSHIYLEECSESIDLWLVDSPFIDLQNNLPLRWMHSRGRSIRSLTNFEINQRTRLFGKFTNLKLIFPDVLEERAYSREAEDMYLDPENVMNVYNILTVSSELRVPVGFHHPLCDLKKRYPLYGLSILDYKFLILCRKAGLETEGKQFLKSNRLKDIGDYNSLEGQIESFKAVTPLVDTEPSNEMKDYSEETSMKRVDERTLKDVWILSRFKTPVERLQNFDSDYNKNVRTWFTLHLKDYLLDDEARHHEVFEGTWEQEYTSWFQEHEELIEVDWLQPVDFYGHKIPKYYLPKNVYSDKIQFNKLREFEEQTRLTRQSVITQTVPVEITSIIVTKVIIPDDNPEEQLNEQDAFDFLENL